jgi:DNA-binding HxlR family transcriptional regulator
MDRDGVRISSELFELTTSGAEPAQLDAVVSELQSVTRGTYGQYCGLSRAVEMIGERWGLLIVRDLLAGAKTATELHQGLPRISTKLLSMRLKEMTYSGVLRPVDVTEPADVAHYELTEYGRALEDVLFALGRWGAMALATPRPEDIITEDSLMVALRATFVPEPTRGDAVGYELHVGDIVVHAKFDDGRLEVARGPLADADAVIDPGPLFKSLLTGEVSVAAALDTGQVSVTGDPALLGRFVSMFRLPDLPSPAPAPA